MRVFVKTTRTIGLAPHELDALTEMIREAKETGKAERQMSSTESLAIEVGDMHERRSHAGKMKNS